MGLRGAPLHLWSDSTVILAWIQGHPSRWKTFVANRVAEIQRVLPEARWRHVAGCENPADCASRRLTPRELLSHSLWWTGPTWLSQDGPGPINQPPTVESPPEERTRTHLTTASTEESEILRAFSRLSRLLRVTAWCARWLVACRKRPPAPTAGLAPLELEEAQQRWIRVVQAVWFSGERRALIEGAGVPNRSALARLSPFVDDQGIIRVGGRLKHAILSPDERHPVILPRGSHLTTLVIRAYHLETMHGGVQLTLGLVRQRFWIPGGRQEVRRHIHRCVTCVRWRAASPHPLMGQLPPSRVTVSRPFTHTGVDYAGPVLVRAAPGRGHKAHKAFMAIFVCFSSRAVHLELVSDYSTEAFLAAFYRFVSQRGLCRTLHSDRGTNFVGADAQLRALFRAAVTENPSLVDALATKGVEWRFNPPAAPHFGGLWEAAVKSALRDDPEDLEALTPGHILTGAALKVVPAPSLASEPSNRLTRWRCLQKMRDDFWRRWSAEYLHALAVRPKWCRPEPNPLVGDLCLLRGKALPPCRWPLARIVGVHPGEDGMVRVVTVRTATTTLKRPVVKIVPLPRHDCDVVQQDEDTASQPGPSTE
ncbi:uncharacterized protein LOC118645340 [Monomorium pharaonis]|uniref:uncharacterized protein LOC118645340 n=1 Tax=Monomorium pharaonis TaxID=307658 RepID=UPI001746ACCC|nr:uncharacterized protein LOC118645340 [Monomorium pharaonis]